MLVVPRVEVDVAEAVCAGGGDDVLIEGPHIDEIIRRSRIG